MSSFVDGAVVRREFDDFDGLGTAFASWELQAARIDGGPFAARFDMAMTTEMQIARLRVSSGLLITGATPRGAGGAGLISSASSGIRSLGRSIDPVINAPARLRQSETHFLSNGPFDLTVIGVEEALFARHLSVRLYEEATRQGTDWLLRAPAGTANCPERACAINSLLSVLSSNAAASRQVKHRLQECVLQILLEGLETYGSSTPVVSSSTRRRVARAAEELLRARLDEPPSLLELCEALNVPERTLHAAFQEGFGMSPKTYLRSLRLSAAHMRLRSGAGSVTDTATELGFFHFGRFSSEYRTMFGEPPSETLRRARGLSTIQNSELAAKARQ
ncbi:helix-turn-helix transcriptional regulator [Falsiroseomonas sp. HC035]|uniref:helix-turn-helix transcriptional regulator n=1 Tax=Falsiroseomonas sp. HC035 TaxID=3390999 RepID=UPI003D31D70E